MSSSDQRDAELRAVAEDICAVTGSGVEGPLTSDSDADSTSSEPDLETALAYLLSAHSPQETYTALQDIDTVTADEGPDGENRMRLQRAAFESPQLRALLFSTFAAPGTHSAIRELIAKVVLTVALTGEPSEDERELMVEAGAAALLGPANLRSLALAARALAATLRSSERLIRRVTDEGAFDRTCQLLAVQEVQKNDTALAAVAHVAAELALLEANARAFLARPAFNVFLSAVTGEGAVGRMAELPLLAVSAARVCQRTAAFPEGRGRLAELGAVEMLTGIIGVYGSRLGEADFFSARNWDQAFVASGVAAALEALAHISAAERTLKDRVLSAGFGAVVALVGYRPGEPGSADICHFAVKVSDQVALRGNVQRNAVLFGREHAEGLCHRAGQLLAHADTVRDLYLDTVRTAVRLLRLFALDPQLAAHSIAPVLPPATVMQLMRLFPTTAPSTFLCALHIRSLAVLLNKACGEAGDYGSAVQQVRMALLTEEERSVVDGTNEELGEDALRANAALTVQRLWRGHVGRTAYRRRLLALGKWQAARSAAEKEEQQHREVVDASEFADRAAMVAEFDEGWGALMKRHDAIQQHRARVDAEVEERQLAERTELSERHDALRAAHLQQQRARLDELESAQEGELRDVEDELADIAELGDSAEAAELRNRALQRRKDITQQHARGRVQLREMLARERDLLAAEQAEEAVALERRQAAEADALRVEVLEERARGYGAWGRRWWMNRGIEAEQRRAWDVLWAEMSFEWLPFGEQSARGAIEAEQDAVRGGALGRRESLTWQLRQGKVTVEEATERVVVLYAGAAEPSRLQEGLRRALLLCRERGLRHALQLEELADGELDERADIGREAAREHLALCERSKLQQRIKLDQGIKALVSEETEERADVDSVYITSFAEIREQCRNPMLGMHINKLEGKEERRRQAVAVTEAEDRREVLFQEARAARLADQVRSNRELVLMEDVGRTEIEGTEEADWRAAVQTFCFMSDRIGLHIRETTESTAREVIVHQCECNHAELKQGAADGQLRAGERAGRREIATAEDRTWGYDDAFWTGYHEVNRQREAAVEQASRGIVEGKEDAARSVLQNYARDSLSQAWFDYYEACIHRDDRAGRSALQQEEIGALGAAWAAHQDGLFRLRSAVIAAEEAAARPQVLAAEHDARYANLGATHVLLLRTAAGSSTAEAEESGRSFLQHALRQALLRAALGAVERAEREERLLCSDREDSARDSVLLAMLKEAAAVRARAERAALAAAQGPPRLEVEAEWHSAWLELREQAQLGREQTERIEVELFEQRHRFAVSDMWGDGAEAAALAEIVAREEIERRVVEVDEAPLFQRLGTAERRGHLGSLLMLLEQQEEAAREEVAAEQELGRGNDLAVGRERLRAGLAQAARAQRERAQQAAAQRMQRAWRSSVARDRVKVARSERARGEEDAEVVECRCHREVDVTTVQTFCRAALWRALAGLLRNRHLHRAAGTIQRMARCRRARRRVDWLLRQRRVRHTRQQREVDESAFRIQWAWRDHRAREESREQQRQWAEARRRDGAAAHIQAGWRGHQGRELVADKRAALAAQRATLVQAHLRAVPARRHWWLLQYRARLSDEAEVVSVHVRALRSRQLRTMLVRHRAARAVQRAWRCHSARMRRRLLSGARAERKRLALRRHAATSIQSAWRGRCGRLRAAPVRERHLAKVAALRDEGERAPVRLLARVGRGAVARRRLLLELHRREDAAVTLQCWARRKAASAECGRRREAQRRKDAKPDIYTDSALTIQRVYRGHRGRSHAQQVLDDHLLLEAAQRALASALQPVGRGLRARRALSVLQRIYTLCARRIQRAWRCRAARMRAARKRAERDARQLAARRLAAARALQRNFRAAQRRRLGAVYRIQGAWLRLRADLLLKCELRDTRRSHAGALRRAEEMHARQLPEPSGPSPRGAVRAARLQLLSTSVPDAEANPLLKAERKARRGLEDDAVAGWRDMIVADRASLKQLVRRLWGAAASATEAAEAAARARERREALRQLRDIRLRLRRALLQGRRDGRRQLLRGEQGGRVAEIHAEGRARLQLEGKYVQRTHELFELAERRRLSSEPPPAAAPYCGLGPSPAAYARSQRIRARPQPAVEPPQLGPVSRWAAAGGGLTPLDPLPPAGGGGLERRQHALTHAALSLAAALRRDDVKGARTAAQTLCSGSALPTSSAVLDLSRARIGGTELIPIFAALGDNHTVAQLCLDDARVGDTAGSALAEALSRNSTLTSVSLAGNRGLTDSGAQGLAAALARNRTLRFMDLEGTGVSLQLRRQVAEQLSANARAAVSEDAACFAPLRRHSSYSGAPVGAAATYSARGRNTDGPGPVTEGLARSYSSRAHRPESRGALFSSADAVPLSAWIEDARRTTALVPTPTG
eukprot:TRINITY_DN19240_c0_g2_i1.p1 TRINITY_DN19240_c0_g2~~TRINITY_DN19240_c0_g2_i1.p1  ORF type:complete len:2408 (+),score=793.22 TRINITY_DN19240_c0_g2_i1:81-7304(+)